MKSKLILLSTATLLAFCTISCDKHCWCYEPNDLGEMRELEAWTDETTPCKTLSTGKRICVEDGERTDPNKIATEFLSKMSATKGK